MLLSIAQNVGVGYNTTCPDRYDGRGIFLPTLLNFVWFLSSKSGFIFYNIIEAVVIADNV